MGQEAFGMELHPNQGELFVADRHDLPLALSAMAPGADLEIVVQCAGADYQAVIAGGLKWVLQALEQPAVVVLNPVGLAVHQPFGPHDLAPEGVPDRLMPQAYAQNRDLTGKV